jgi:hypothetical protein
MTQGGMARTSCAGAPPQPAGRGGGAQSSWIFRARRGPIGARLHPAATPHGGALMRVNTAARGRA